MYPDCSCTLTVVLSKLLRKRLLKLLQNTSHLRAELQAFKVVFFRGPMGLFLITKIKPEGLPASALCS